MNKPTRHSPFRTVGFVIETALLAVLAAGLRRRNSGAVVNAVLALAGTFLPQLAERRYGVRFEPWQRVYTTTAMFNHAAGMLGPYDDTWWWDHLTHTHSATLLGAFVHVRAHRNGRDPRPYVLCVVGCGGFLWECLEYTVHTTARRLDLDPVLVTYGTRDTLLDIVFDFVGALLVCTFGDRFLGNFTQDDE